MEEATSPTYPSRDGRTSPRPSSSGRGRLLADCPDRLTWRRCPSIRLPSSALPHIAAESAEHDCRSDRDEPGQKTENHADGAVQLAIGGNGRGEIQRGKAFEPHPIEGGDGCGKAQASPCHSAAEKEVHRPPEEQSGYDETEENINNKARRQGVRRRADDAIE